VRNETRDRRSGFTMVELLVVLAVVALLTGLAIPTIARLGPGSRDEVSNTSQTVFSLLKAARIYAATHRTEAAVVYVFDNYRDPPIPADTPIAEPVFDTILNQPVRIIRGAAVVAKNECGVFVPIPRSEGQFTEFPQGACILLQSPAYDEAPYYQDLSVRYVPAGGNLSNLGMGAISLVIDGDSCDPNNRTEVAFPGHIYTARGILKASGRERFTIHVSQTPDLAAELRVINTTDLTSPVQATPIHLYRSTGRVKIAS